MKIFLAVAAVLAWLFGTMLILAPARFYAPTGIALTPMLATLAQAHGATLIGLGVIDWLARNADPRVVRAVLIGNLVVQLLSLAVVARTISLGVSGAAMTPAIVIHVVLGTLFAYFLSRAPKTA